MMTKYIEVWHIELIAVLLAKPVRICTDSLVTNGSSEMSSVTKIGCMDLIEILGEG